MASGAAKRYAQAVLSLARDRKSLDAWQADLGTLNALMADPKAGQFFASPRISLREKVQLLDSALLNAQPEARNLARLLAERNRLGIVGDLYRIYNDARLAEQGIAVANVTTADDLNPAEQAVIAEQLKRLVGKEIELRLKTDPAIIGGIVARVGDQLIDGSVVTRLRQLRARLSQA
jgi:F-type H+-transporting ATPase subunit delta